MRFSDNSRQGILLLILWLMSLTGTKGQTIEQLQAQIRTSQLDTTRLRLYCDLNHLFESRGEYDSLYPVIQRALPLATRLRSDFYTARILVTLGLYYRSKGLFNQAVSQFQTAIHLFNQLQKLPHSGRALFHLSRTYADQNNKQQAIKQALLNINFFTKHRLNDLLMATYSLLSAIYEDLNNKSLSTYYAGKYAQLAERSPHLTTRIIALYDKAIGYEEQGAFERAWPYRQKSLTYARRVNNSYYLITCLCAAAANLRQRGRLTEALAYTVESLRQNKEQYGPELARSLQELALDYQQLGDHQRALQAAQRGLGMVRKSNFKGGLLAALETLASVQETAGQYKEALATTKQVAIQRDSLLSLDKQKAIAQLQATHDLENKEHQISLLHKNARLQRFQAAQQERKLWQLILGIGALISLVSLIGLLLHRANETRRLLLNQNQLIENQAYELQEANRLKDQLFSIVGHDLRAPILNMDYLLKEVQQSGLPAMIGPSLLNQLADRVGQLGRLVDNLLYWSLGQQGLLRDRIEPLDLMELLRDCLALFSDIIRRRALVVVTRNHLAIRPWADERQLQIIVRNLLDNAIKFSPTGGRIEIQCINQSDGFRLEITNQIDAHRDRSTGATLGLKTVTELVHRLNGALTISQPQTHCWRASLHWPQASHPVGQSELIADR